MKIRFPTLVCLLVSSFGSVYANEGRTLCKDLFAVDQLPLKPVLSSDIHQIQTDPETVDLSHYGGSGYGLRVLPTATSKLGAFSSALSKKGVSVFLSESAFPVSAVSISALRYVNGAKIVDKAIVLKPSLVTTSIAGHEAFHAVNAAKLFDELTTAFGGQFSRERFSEYIQPRWDMNRIYVRQNGDRLSGEVIAGRFRAAYEEVDEEEVHTFAKQLVQRTFINDNKKTLQLIRELGREPGTTLLKTDQVILHHDELDAEIVPAEFFIYNFGDLARKALTQLDRHLSEELPENIGRRVVGIYSEMGTLKRRVYLDLDSIGYNFENVSPTIFDQIKKLIIENDYSRITTEVLPKLRSILAEKVTRAERIETAYKSYILTLESLRFKPYLTTREYLMLKDATARLGTAVTAASRN